MEMEMASSEIVASGGCLCLFSVLKNECMNVDST